MTALTTERRETLVDLLHRHIGFYLSEDADAEVSELIDGWLEAEYQRGYDAGCDDPESAWTSTIAANRMEAAAEVRARVEALDFTGRRLGMAFPDPWREGWNRALEVCRDDLRLALDGEQS